MLQIKNLCVSLDNNELLHNINLDIKDGARHLLNGHNGSGKTTLVSTIAGNPQYKITSGQITFDGTDITSENATNRALRGIFIGSQNVPEIPGLTVLSLLKHSLSAHTHFQTGKDLSMAEFLS
ncbi:MAG: ATP-binding cassette domain-containing protein, partial [Alphaproteobacteria bacterium]